MYWMGGWSSPSRGMLPSAPQIGQTDFYLGSMKLVKVLYSHCTVPTVHTYVCSIYVAF